MLRSGSRIGEIAILIDDVLYYTLPCIAELAFPDPAKCRHNIIQGEDRVRSVSELPAMRPPHGNPGAWTTEVAREFNISANKLAEQLVVQLGVCEKCWPYIQKTWRTYYRFQPTRKGSRNNQYGTTFARSRSRRSSGRATRTSPPPSAS